MDNGRSSGKQRPRWPGFSREGEIAWVRKHRKTMLAEMVKAEKRSLAERISATRRLFRRKLLIGDIHSHTVFSDGVSTVAETKEMADLLGLDFLFVTDHRTLRHRRYCDEKSGPWWGQEPPSKGMDIGLLMNDRLFVPRCDSFPEDFRRAQSRAPFVWVPHPTGYGQNTWYPDEVVDNLWHLGDRFALEALSGAGKLRCAYNAISAKAISVWDQLLCAGRRVTVVGGSDAHICYSIGTAWTGVYASACNPKAVVAALSQGHGFASEGPLLWLGCGRAIMGDVVRRRPGARIALRFVAADAGRLRSARLVSNGKVVREITAKNAPRLSGVFETVVGEESSYFRLECMAADQRRAFSSPIFISSQERVEERG